MNDAKELRKHLGRVFMTSSGMLVMLIPSDAHKHGVAALGFNGTHFCVEEVGDSLTSTQCRCTQLQFFKTMLGEPC